MQSEMRLRANAVGFWGVVFYAISAIFPAGIFAVTGVTALTYAGEAAPLSFLVGGGVLFFAVISIYIFSQRISNAGGYYKFVEAGIPNKYVSKSVGLWNAFWIIGDLIAASIVVGWFTWVGFSSLLNYSLPFYFIVLLTLILPILYLLVGYLGIKVTAGSAVVLGLAQLVIVSTLAVAVIIKAPYNSGAYFNIANSLNGLHGFFLAMVIGAFLAYGGYGSVLSIAEEAKLPKKNIKKAVVTALLIMIAFDTLVVYSIVAAAGPHLSTVDGFFAPGLYVTRQFFGLGIALFAFLSVLIAQLLSPIIFGNTGARILFALSRDGFLPKSLSKVNKKYGSPFIAILWTFLIIVVGAIATLIPMVYVFGESNGLFFSFVLWAIAITIFTLLYHIITNAALPFFLRKMGSGIRPFTHLIAPSIGSVIMIVAIYYSLLGLTYPLSLAYVMIPAWIVIGLLSIYFRRKKTKVESTDQLMEEAQ